MIKLQEFIEQVRKRIEKATPGEWQTLWGNTVQVNGENIAVLNDGEYIENQNRENDAKFIVHARTDLELALAVIEKQRQALEKLKAGPGNNMSNWKFTWAHQFSRNCLADCENILEKA